MNLISLTTPEEIRDFFGEEKKVEITEETKVGVVTDKLRYVKVHPGGNISLSDGKVELFSNEPKYGKKFNKR